MPLPLVTGRACNSALHLLQVTKRGPRAQAAKEFTAPQSGATKRKASALPRQRSSWSAGAWITSVFTGGSLGFWGQPQWKCSPKPWGVLKLRQQWEQEFIGACLCCARPGH